MLATGTRAGFGNKGRYSKHGTASNTAAVTMFQEEHGPKTVSVTRFEKISMSNQILSIKLNKGVVNENNRSIRG